MYAVAVIKRARKRIMKPEVDEYAERESACVVNKIKSIQGEIDASNAEFLIQECFALISSRRSSSSEMKVPNVLKMREVSRLPVFCEKWITSQT